MSIESRHTEQPIGLAAAFKALKPYSITVINGEVLVDFDSGPTDPMNHRRFSPEPVDATSSTFLEEEKANPGPSSLS